jgi:hypothetical protein
MSINSLVIFFILVVGFVIGALLSSISMNRTGEVVDGAIDDAAGTGPNFVLVVAHYYRLTTALFS